MERNELTGFMQRARKNGILVNPKICSKCKRKGIEIIAHHESYDKDKWLDVTWLCWACHHKRHKEILKWRKLEEYLNDLRFRMKRRKYNDI